MPSKPRKRDSKDSATKNTFNPPGPKPEAQVRNPDTREREVGQSTGRGVPPLMKK
jgi:hypothetical protein